MKLDRKRAFGLAAEVCFALLPLTIVLIVLLRFRHPSRVFSSPEWSFGAAILFGQSLVKFLTGLTQGERAAPGPVALAVSLIILVGLAPSLIVLTFVLSDLEATPPSEPSQWLAAAQVVLFAFSAVAYFIFGAVGELWLQGKRTARESAATH